MTRNLSRTDNLIQRFDTALRTLVPHAAKASRPSPATAELHDASMSDRERRHAAGVMRITHTGEVCAQALYQSQALTTWLPEVRDLMEVAAREGIDRLAWCDERLQELHDRPSCLNPFFYATAFGIGTAAGAAGNRVGLGFVAATEEQVGKSLDRYQQALPPADHRSRAVLRRMAIDEAHYAQLAFEAGGARFPAPVKAGMSLMSKVMTKSVYKL